MMRLLATLCLALALAAAAQPAPNAAGSGADEARAARLRESLRTAPENERLPLELLLTHLYRSIYAANRAEIARRAGPEKPDALATWGAARFLNEIEAQYLRVLAYEPVLKATPAEEYDALLEKGAAPDAYRPTLYDLVAHELIEFYGWKEPAAADDGPNLDAEGPAFEDVAAFRFLIPEEAARRSRVLRALRLFQGLLAFHERDEDPTAFAAADLQRLQFCREHSEGARRDERYAAALDRFAQTWRRHEVSALASALRAKAALEAGEAPLARTLAQAGAAAFPKSAGAALCRALVAEVEAPWVTFSVERMWCPPWPELEIRYRNVQAAQFRAVAVPFDEYLQAGGERAEADPAFGAALLKRAPGAVWEAALPGASDGQTRQWRTRVPEQLPAGLYAVFASTDGTFAAGGKPVDWCLVRVSSLALVVERGGPAAAGFVLTARGGEPVAGARVQVWRREGTGAWRRGATLASGPDGAFSLGGAGAGELMLLASKGGEAAHTWSPLQRRAARPRGRAAEPQALFLTDRAVCQPGDALGYMGISFVADTQSGSYYAVGGKSVTVRLCTSNGTTLAEQRVTNTVFGSFSGALAVPPTTGPSKLTLSAEGLEGRADVEVDSRPPAAYAVTLGPPEPDARLGAMVSVAGTVRTPDGAPTGGVRVAWRIYREAAPNEPEPLMAAAAQQPLASGGETSDRSGRFAVTFFARAPGAMARDARSATYRVVAEAGGPAGSANASERRLTLGDATWEASLSCRAWQTDRAPVLTTVRLRDRQGRGVRASGKVTVYTVRQPTGVTRPRFAEPSDAQTEGAETWPDEREVAAEPVETDPQGEARLALTLKAGLYRMRFQSRDGHGKPVAAQRLVTVIAPGAERLGLRVPNHFAAEAWRVEPGGTFRAVWGSGYETACATLLVERDGRVLLRRSTEPGETQLAVELPVTEAMRGGVTVRTLFVRENRLYTESRVLEVPWSGKRLEVAAEREPGERPTWRASVRGASGEEVSAEVAALLYDRARDDASALRWPASFDAYFERCSESGSFALENGAVRFERLFGEWERPAAPPPKLFRTWRDGAGDARPDAVPAASADRPRAATRGAVAFRPQLATDTHGAVTIDPQVPVLPERWRLLLFAHDERLRAGYLEMTSDEGEAAPSRPRTVPNR